MIRGLLLTNPVCELGTLIGPNTLDQIEVAVQRVLSEHGGLPDADRLSLVLAARKVGMVITAGAASGMPQRLWMAIRCFPNLVQISFSDDGGPADAERRTAVTLRGGRVHYHRNQHGNHWTVLKTWRPDSVRLGTALSTAEGWVDEVARQLGTAEKDFAGRVLQSWLRLLRQRITAEAAQKFGADLPDPVHRIFCSGWDAGSAAAKGGAAAYTIRFGRAAGIAVQDVGAVATATTAAVMRLMPPATVTEVLAGLRSDVRAIIVPATPPPALVAGDFAAASAGLLSRIPA